MSRIQLQTTNLSPHPQTLAVSQPSSRASARPKPRTARSARNARLHRKLAQILAKQQGYN